MRATFAAVSNAWFIDGSRRPERAYVICPR